MKKKQNKSLGASPFQIALALTLISLSAILFASSLTSSPGGGNATSAAPAQPNRPMPDVVQMVGPVRVDQNLRNLPYIPQEGETEEQRLMRYPHPQTGAPPPATSSAWLQTLMKGLWRPTPTMPAPLLTFEGGAAAQFCACAPPDSDGDVGPNHYVEAINNAFAIYDKSGSTLAGPITYNTLYAA